MDPETIFVDSFDADLFRSFLARRPSNREEVKTAIVESGVENAQKYIDMIDQNISIHEIYLAFLDDIEDPPPLSTIMLRYAFNDNLFDEQFFTKHTKIITTMEWSDYDESKPCITVQWIYSSLNDDICLNIRVDSDGQWYIGYIEVSFDIPLTQEEVINLCPGFREYIIAARYEDI